MPDTETKSAEPRELKTIELDRQLCWIRFTPDGSQLLGGGYDATIRRFDFTGEEPQELEPTRGHHGWVWQLAIAPAGDTVFAVDTWGGLAAWPIADEKPQAKWFVENAHDGWIRSLNTTPDAARLVTGGRDKMVRLWNAAGEKLGEFAGHEHPVYAVAVHSDGKSIVSADLMGTVKHWNAETGECVRSVDVPKMHFYERDQDTAGIYGLRFHDDGRTLILAGSEPTDNGNVGGRPTLKFLDWNTLEETSAFVQNDITHGYVHDFDWRPEGYWSAVTSGRPGKGQVLFWRPGEEKPFWVTTKYANCHSLAWHADGRRFVVAATNRRSQGNGAVRDEEGNYVGNFSPLHLFTTEPEAS